MEYWSLSRYLKLRVKSVCAFTETGGEVSQSIARWGATPEPSFASVPWEITFQSGDPIVLDVPALGGQATTVSWMKDGAPLVDDGRIVGTATTSVMISDGNPTDAGTYEAALASACGASIIEIEAVFVPAPSCAGDISGDGFTNAADFTILAGNFGSAVTPNTSGDLNGDGVVNAADFVILAGDFGCGS